MLLINSTAAKNAPNQYTKPKYWFYWIILMIIKNLLI
jgi:hypothetical protein